MAPASAEGSHGCPLIRILKRENVAAQEADPGSLLRWYKSLIALRRTRAELREGMIEFLDLAPDILAYERRLAVPGRARILVFLNFSRKPRVLGFSEPMKILIGSARPAGEELGAAKSTLQPYEVVIAEPFKR